MVLRSEGEWPFVVIRGVFARFCRGWFPGVRHSCTCSGRPISALLCVRATSVSVVTGQVLGDLRSPHAAVAEVQSIPTARSLTRARFAQRFEGSCGKVAGLRRTRQWMTGHRFLSRAAIGAALLVIVAFATTANAFATSTTTDPHPGITAPPSVTPAAGPQANALAAAGGGSRPVSGKNLQAGPAFTRTLPASRPRSNVRGPRAVRHGHPVAVHGRHLAAPRPDGRPRPEEAEPAPGPLRGLGGVFKDRLA